MLSSTKINKISLNNNTIETNRILVSQILQKDLLKIIKAKTRARINRNSHSNKGLNLLNSRSIRAAPVKDKLMICQIMVKLTSLNKHSKVSKRKPINNIKMHSTEEESNLLTRTSMLALPIINLQVKMIISNNIRAKLIN